MEAFWDVDKKKVKLKADRPHPRDYSTHRQTPWTDNDSSLLFAAQTNKQTNKRTLPSALSPCFAVDNKSDALVRQYCSGRKFVRVLTQDSALLHGVITHYHAG